MRKLREASALKSAEGLIKVAVPALALTNIIGVQIKSGNAKDSASIVLIN